MLQMKKIIFTLALMFASQIGKAQLQIGDMAPEITLPDTKDSIIKLSSLKGKVVLVDFWASWCAPCRGANPYIQKIYKKHKNKGIGFEVFAVSIDAKKDAWLKAIKKDKLTYTQVNENTGWYSKVAGKYFVDALPTNFLLDETGRIVAINIEGNQLAEKLKEMLK